MVEFWWLFKVGWYAQKSAQNWLKCQISYGKTEFSKNFKFLFLFTSFYNFLENGHEDRSQECKQNYEFRFFDFFQKLALFGHFGPKMGFFGFFGPKWPKNPIFWKKFKNLNNMFCLHPQDPSLCPFARKLQKLVKRNRNLKFLENPVFL